MYVTPCFVYCTRPRAVLMVWKASSLKRIWESPIKILSLGYLDSGVLLTMIPLSSIVTSDLDVFRVSPAASRPLAMTFDKSSASLLARFQLLLLKETVEATEEAVSSAVVVSAYIFFPLTLFIFPKVTEKSSGW